MNRLDKNFDWNWHRALNAFNYPKDKPFNSTSWMYLAKAAADEIPRMAMMFAKERLGKLPTIHHQCSHDVDGTPIENNHLTCCMGVKCRECPFLLALDKMEDTPENIDIAKAWTCATHILFSKSDQNFDTSEGFLQTVDDRMYWQNLYSSMASISDSESEDHDETYRN